MKLQEHRDSIDAIDTQIVSLIAQRKHEVDGVIAAKKASDQAAHQPVRFEQVIERVRASAIEYGIDPDVVEEIWHTLHTYFLQIEKEELS